MRQWRQASLDCHICLKHVGHSQSPCLGLRGANGSGPCLMGLSVLSGVETCKVFFSHRRFMSDARLRVSSPMGVVDGALWDVLVSVWVWGVCMFSTVPFCFFQIWLISFWSCLVRWQLGQFGLAWDMETLQ